MQQVKGDLLAMGKNNEFDIVVQGCNCWCKMGSGIAAQIRKQFPDAWLADNDTLPGDRNKLGSYTIGLGEGLIIVNAYTQYNTAKYAGEDVFEYRAFQAVLDKLLVRFGTYRMGFPFIGMGLAGGDSVRIMAMLEQFSRDVSAKGGTVTLVEYA